VTMTTAMATATALLPTRLVGNTTLAISITTTTPTTNNQQPRQRRQSTWPATCNALKFTCHKFPHKAADSASASASTSASTSTDAVAVAAAVVAAAFVDSHLCV